MKRCNFSMVRLLPFGLVVFLLLAGCKEPIPTAESVDQSLAGSWTLDTNKTLQAQIDSLTKQKILNSDEDIQTFKRDFSSTYFTVQLNQDATFECSMGTSLDRGIFSGHWNNDGDKMSMVQTHEGTKEKRDKMTGHIIDGQLHMNHTAQGITVQYIFEKVELAEDQIN